MGLVEAHVQNGPEILLALTIVLAMASFEDHMAVLELHSEAS